MIDNYSEEQFKSDVKKYFKENDCRGCEFYWDCEGVTSCLEEFVSKSFKTIKVIQDYAKENKR